MTQLLQVKEDMVLKHKKFLNKMNIDDLKI